MSMHPYLFFTNTTRAAMTRYQEIFGGKLEIMNASELPPGEEAPFEASPDLVMHAALMFGDGDLLMASDDPTGDGSGVKGMSINISLTDEHEVRRIFDELAQGGSIDMPLEATFWSPLFGACVDRFGVAWMVNFEAST